MKEDKIMDTSREGNGLESIETNENIITNLEQTNDKIATLGLVGKNKAYFEKIFKKIDEGDSKFNWCGFLFTIYYIIYRKMFKQYLKSSIAVLTVFMLIIILSLMALANPFSIFLIIVGILVQMVYTVLSCVYPIYIGVTFNERYYSYLKNLNNSDMNLEQLKLNTGVSGKRLAASIGISIILFLIIVATLSVIILTALLFYGILITYE